MKINKNSEETGTAPRDHYICMCKTHIHTPPNYSTHKTRIENITGTLIRVQGSCWKLI